MEDTETDTEIIYVPGARNVYKPEFDVIVLDEQLKDYPKAHEYVREHELEHAKQAANDSDGVVEHIVFEIANDARTCFGTDETARELREYLSTYDPPNPMTWRELAIYGTANQFLRPLWKLFMVPSARVYRRLRGVFGEGKELWTSRSN